VRADVSQLNDEFERRLASQLLEVLIRAGLLGAFVVLCYRVFAPFLTLLLWALILAVTLYPLHQSIARRLGGNRGLAATIIVLVGSLSIVTPTVVLVSSFEGSVRKFVSDAQQNKLEIPAPHEGVREWPIVGERIHDVWSKAHADLPGLIQSMQPQILELVRKALVLGANIAVMELQFLASFVIAGILMAYGETGARLGRAISVRIVGGERGERFARLSTATIRAVAQGVVGIAFVQAVLIGVALLVADVPWAGVLAGITLVLSVAQVPALVVTLPVIGYIWSSGSYGTGAAILHTIVLLLAGMVDNALKPLMLGRGVEAPMPVVLLGALGGLATAGILGMFVGATLLALGHQMFMVWLARAPSPDVVVAKEDSTRAS
jgi:predicted PurR-regulated permease PerM